MMGERLTDDDLNRIEALLAREWPADSTVSGRMIATIRQDQADLRDTRAELEELRLLLGEQAIPIMLDAAEIIDDAFLPEGLAERRYLARDGLLVTSKALGAFVAAAATKEDEQP